MEGQTTTGRIRGGRGKVRVEGCVVAKRKRKDEDDLFLKASRSSAFRKQNYFRVIVPVIIADCVCVYTREREGQQSDIK